MVLGSGSTCPLAHQRPPHMRFVSLRPELCLRLPSHPASRRRSCRSARGTHHQGPQRTFTSKSLPGSLSLASYRVSGSPGTSCHAWHTSATAGCAGCSHSRQESSAYGQSRRTSGPQSPLSRPGVGKLPSTVQAVSEAPLRPATMLTISTFRSGESISMVSSLSAGKKRSIRRASARMSSLSTSGSSR